MSKPKKKPAKRRKPDAAASAPGLASWAPAATMPGLLKRVKRTKRAAEKSR